MTETNDTIKSFIYVLVMVGDVTNTGSTIYVHVDVSSFNKETLEMLAREKNETFRKEAFDEGWEEGEEYTYGNTDYSGLPYWTVTQSTIV